MDAWCYEGEIENCFVSWEDSDTDTDPQQVVMRVRIKTIWRQWIFDSNCSWIKRKLVKFWQNLCQKKVKHFHKKLSIWSFYEDNEYSRQMPGKKDYVSIS